MGDGSSSFAFPAIIGIFKRRNGNQMYVNRTFGTQSRAGFINTTNSQIELYNIADGFLTRRLSLPDDASINATFNFAYTNGMFWLFNMEERTWTSYK